MSRTMLIDADHREETRVVVLDGDQLEDFDFESATKKQLRGNIYLAKVTRVEPSLQACFVEYGGNRHGFLAAGEIHPDYYQIPASDRAALLAEEAAAAASHDDDDDSDETDDDGRARRAASRRYKIQEVIRRRQVMLVQVVKEERGNKGAALTTYLSLAGRYCVLMPNTPRGGGVSRKITAVTDRKRLKKISADLEVPQGMGLIIRTAGAKRTKAEIRRDYEYLLRLWDDIRERTLASMAPAAIHEEDNLVKRAIRDLYEKDVSGIYVAGEHAYREAKDFVRMLMPSHAKKVMHHKDRQPIFSSFGVERQLDEIYSPVVQLRSGGYIVINQTEALVAIDVNSGRATKERSIESTALKTNLEAAEEACRQMRLRDLAGLLVIDFIDMDESKNDRAVEKKMKDGLALDRARVQMGRISGFGLLEISRQRRRTGIMEGSSHICPSCDGSGRIRSADSAALALLRQLEDATMDTSIGILTARASMDTALYLLNEKRDHLSLIEERHQVIVRVLADPTLPPGRTEIETTERAEPLDPETEAMLAARNASTRLRAPEPDEFDEVEEEIDDEVDANEEDNDGEAAEADDGAADTRPAVRGETEESADGRKKRRRRRRRGGSRDSARDGVTEAVGDGSEIESEAASASDDDDPTEETSDDAPRAGETAAETESRRRRRRGRRGGRRRREGEEVNVAGGEGHLVEADPGADGGEPSVDQSGVMAATAPSPEDAPLETSATEPEAIPASVDVAPAASIQDIDVLPRSADETVADAPEPSAPIAPAIDAATPTIIDDGISPEENSPAEPILADQPVVDPPPKKRGWWQQRFGG